MKNRLILLGSIWFLTLFSGSLSAKEGMWLPWLLSNWNEADMQAMGMQLTAEDVYSINQASLKDAIVSFGGFCTAEVIYSKGLILTNHLCGYGQIQKHSTVENDLLKNGFWAMSGQEELTNPGLTATFIKYVKDVTNDILLGTTPGMDEAEFQKIIKDNIEKAIEREKTTTDYDLFVRPFYYGNQYFLFAVETFRDVRLVGAPPSSIGKYGADTDNWVWPRHTGDFSLFRIYAGK
ncbi:MAG: S46 family peptidase, partial [Bacteroidota bacterium]|nr:S46 family peptidase [Bacteroidota bacterium]